MGHPFFYWRKIGVGEYLNTTREGFLLSLNVVRLFDDGVSFLVIIKNTLTRVGVEDQEHFRSACVR